MCSVSQITWLGSIKRVGSFASHLTHWIFSPKPGIVCNIMTTICTSLCYPGWKRCNYSPSVFNTLSALLKRKKTLKTVHTWESTLRIHLKESTQWSDLKNHLVWSCCKHEFCDWHMNHDMTVRSNMNDIMEEQQDNLVSGSPSMRVNVIVFILFSVVKAS